MGDVSISRGRGGVGGLCQNPPSPPSLAVFWPINCILHRSSSQSQTAVHHRQNSLMGKKAKFPSGHGSCFPLRETRREREREREYNTDLSPLVYLKTASPRDNKSSTIDETTETKRLIEGVF